MKIGQEGDKRRFPPACKDDYEITKDIPFETRDRVKHCEVCGLEVGETRKAFRTGDDTYQCFRCWNEGHG